MAVPCTVDNDLMMVDTSFGFDTACTEVCSEKRLRITRFTWVISSRCKARDCISAAYVEATCNANCIGMVLGAQEEKHILEILVRLFFCSVVVRLLDV